MRSLAQVPRERAFGADVRGIASAGFTYLQIPAETEQPPRLGDILPALGRYAAKYAYLCFSGEFPSRESLG